jgi:hypothetical protein
VPRLDAHFVGLAFIVRLVAGDDFGVAIQPGQVSTVVTAETGNVAATAPAGRIVSK